MSETAVVPDSAGVRRRSNGAAVAVALCALILSLLSLGVRSRLGAADTVVAGALTSFARLFLVVLPVALVLGVIGILLTPTARPKVWPWLLAVTCTALAVISVIAAIGAARALQSSDACEAVGRDRAGVPAQVLRVRWFPPVVECSAFTGPGDSPPSVVASHWAVWWPVFAVPVALLSIRGAIRRRPLAAPSEPAPS